MATLIIVNNKNKIAHASRVSISNHYCNYVNDKLEICSKWLIFFFHCLISFYFKGFSTAINNINVYMGKSYTKKE